MGATVRIENVQYGEAGGQALLLDIVRPDPIPDTLSSEVKRDTGIDSE